MPQARAARRTKRQARTQGVGGMSDRPSTLPLRNRAVLCSFSGTQRVSRQVGGPVHGWWVMGHLFVPAALVLWVGVAVVRMWAAPAPNPAQAVEVQAKQPRQAEPSEQSVSKANPPAKARGEG